MELRDKKRRTLGRREGGPQRNIHVCCTLIRERCAVCAVANCVPHGVPSPRAREGGRDAETGLDTEEWGSSAACAAPSALAGRAAVRSHAPWAGVLTHPAPWRRTRCRGQGACSFEHG
eukprot:1565958-Prymnesium_polylepis.2